MFSFIFIQNFTFERQFMYPILFGLGSILTSHKVSINKIHFFRQHHQKFTFQPLSMPFIRPYYKNRNNKNIHTKNKTKNFLKKSVRTLKLKHWTIVKINIHHNATKNNKIEKKHTPQGCNGLHQLSQVFHSYCIFYNQNSTKNYKTHSQTERDQVHETHTTQITQSTRENNKNENQHTFDTKLYWLTMTIYTGSCLDVVPIFKSNKAGEYWNKIK